MKFPIRMFESSILRRLSFFSILVAGVVIADSSLNETPTDILLDNNSVAENQPAGTPVGKLILVDIEDADGPVLPALGTTTAVGTEKWSFETGDDVYSSPVIDVDGTVYVGSLDHKVYAIDGETGEKIWEFETGDKVYGSPAIGDNDILYVGSGDHRVYAINATDGQKLWEYQTGDLVSSSPALSADGNVYVGSEDGNVYALDGVTGEKIWEFVAGNRVYNSPAVSADGVVYVGTVSLGASQNARAITFEGGASGIFGTPAGMGSGVVVEGIGTNIFKTGRPVGNSQTNRLEMHGQQFTAPENSSFAVSRLVYFNGVTYLGSTVGSIPFNLSVDYTNPLDDSTDFSFSFNLQFTPNNGTEEENADILTILDVSSSTIFEVNGEDYTLSLVGFSTDGGNTIKNQYTLYEDTDTESFLYADIAKPLVYKLYALDGETGEKLWEFQTGDEIYSSPAIGADGTVYVGSDDRFVYALNGATGQKLWEFQAGNDIKSSPAIGADGTVYVGSADNRLYALNGQTGAKLWDFQAGNDILSSPAVGNDGTVYVGSHDNHIHAVNGQTGQQVWELMVDSNIHSSPLLAMDGTLYFGSDDNKLHAVQTGSSPADSNWPMFRQNPQGNGRVGGGALYISFNLVDGEGDTDNEFFRVGGDELQLAAPLNYEAQPTYSVRLRGYDTGGLSHEKVFTVHTTDAPDAPTDIAIDNDNVAENEGKGELVGNLSTSDEDAGEKHTFKLIDRPGDEPVDNALFNISGNKLSTNAVFDFEAQVHYTVHVEVTDRDKLTFARDIDLHVTDANDAPTGGALSPATIAENQPKGAEIGSLTATDPDAVDSHTYKIVGGEDKSLFKVVDGKLVSHAVYDFETQSEMEVIIRVTDAAKATHDATFNITVADTNDSPDDILLDNNSIAENQPDGGIGKLTLLDPDHGDTAGFELVSGKDDTGNAAFTIGGVELQLASPMNHEIEDEYSIRIKGTDSGGLSIERVFTILVTNLPEAPVGITLDNNTVEENLKKGTIVGSLAAIDEDAGEKHTFKLVDAQSGSANDNSLFAISGSSLKTNAAFDYEARSGYTIHVEVTDRNKLTHAQDLLIDVLDANDAPTGGALAPSTIAENLPKGTEVGILSATDPDTGDAHTYKLQGGDDKSRFKITGNKLISNAVFDYEAQPGMEIIIRVSDAAKAYVDVPLTITITDVNDAPTDITLDNNTVAENEPADTVVGKLTLIDPDGTGGPGIGSTNQFDFNNGLVAYYPFNGNANDESGNGNDGMVYGVTLVEDRFGNEQRAYSFDGVDDWIEVPHSELINFEKDDSYTISCWVSIDPHHHWQGSIYEKWLQTSGPYPYALRCISKGPGFYYFSHLVYDNNQSFNVNTDGLIEIQTGILYNIVVTYRENMLNIHINNTLKG